MHFSNMGLGNLDSHTIQCWVSGHDRKYQEFMLNQNIPTYSQTLGSKVNTSGRKNSLAWANADFSSELFNEDMY
jgi:hypothetical protein